MRPAIRLAAAARAAMEAAAAPATQRWRTNLRGESWLASPRDARWWTARRPDEPGAPGVGADGRVRALPELDLAALTVEGLQAYMDNAWLIDDALFAALRGEEAFFAPPWHGMRRPQVFYYGHCAAFYVNKLVEAGVLGAAERVDPQLEVLFEMGVDEKPGDDMALNVSPWPSLARVLEFRKSVYARVCDALAREAKAGSLSGRVDSEHPLWALVMAVEHQRVHVETSSVLFREMPLELLQSSDHLAPAHPSARRASTGGGEAGTAAATPVAGVDFPPTRLLAHAGGRVTLGRPANASPLRYGWDLEFGRRDVTVTPFEAAACKVSNGELAAFVADGGYATRAHWTAEGWAWCQSVGARAPPFWARGGSALRLLLNEAPMQWDWPAVVSAHEASAYCNWRTAREGALPSRAYRPLREAEHALLRSHNGGELGESNHCFDWTSERPVDGGAAAPSGHHDLLGNLWEHCADDASPLDGFTPHALYPDYSAPAFGPHHTMLVGGSFASSGAYASAACRNYFRPHFVQHAGFRLARDAAAAAAG